MKDSITYQYKNTFDMTAEELKNFANNPAEWMLNQLAEAIKHDPLLAKCYHAYMAVHKEEEDCYPFEQLDFFILLAYQALMSNAINQEQLIQAAQRTVKPIIIPVHTLS